MSTGAKVYISRPSRSLGGTNTIFWCFDFFSGLFFSTRSTRYDIFQESLPYSKGGGGGGGRSRQHDFFYTTPENSIFTFSRNARISYRKITKHGQIMGEQVNISLINGLI